ncbi:hypothetical protein GKZ89_15800 [Bacillus mangrovi]|uniref:DnaD domain-containing protein n=1 Tax=Metabacillus mangrovi TaxID=1491830 RepID=A0A7X2S7Z4_9BACI|nr:DnaD domain protein [Metabacillus mangrovi]MTH54866.1 hypothetical protein [Metabacillus mangrovi]
MKENNKNRTVQGETPEERFKELHGTTIEEWHEQQFKAKTGMSSEEWYINKVKSSTPIDFIEEHYGIITEDDRKLIKDLQTMGLNDEVIYVLLDYENIFSSIGRVHLLVKEMGEHWLKENINTIEKAIAYVKEQQRKERASNASILKLDTLK